MQSSSDPNYVQVVPNEADRRVDIVVGGKPFTSYMWPTTVKKPVLYPLRSANGVVVTRGFPPRPGERVDHPHHVGLWFNYGDVNNLDFWNNSDAIPASQASKYGTIVHRSIRSAKSGEGEGVLETTEEWVRPDQKPILREDTKYVFHAALGARTIERITTLTALDTEVDFIDNKEGVIGMRVARQLEHPSLQP
ncbi:MAG TPA: PmoA family protein, partial [Gemmatimonadaceae bacterium]